MNEKDCLFGVNGFSTSVLYSEGGGSIPLRGSMALSSNGIRNPVFQTDQCRFESGQRHHALVVYWLGHLVLNQENGARTPARAP